MRFLAAILLCILTGCASAPETPVVETPFWERIFDEIPWENRIVGSIVAEVNILPNDLFQVMLKYGYQYANSTHQVQRKEGIEVGERIYELEREYASYDPSDDTFVFIGTFYPDESKYIWILFTKDEDYLLYPGPLNQEKEEYRNTRVSGRLE
jgi:hypothetical protein